MSSVSSGGSVSSVGIGSGLDVTSIISGLMKVEKLPLTNLQTSATKIQTTISAFGDVTSKMSAFRDAAASLALPSTWNATTGASSDSTAVSVAASSNAATGSYAIQVQGLASSQSTVSGTFASSSALVGAGTLHFDLGSWDSTNTAFTAKTGGSTVDVAVTADDTLDTLAAKVNSASAGVTATVVNDSTGSRLVFSSRTTGVANGFKVTGDGGAAALGYDGSGTGSTLTQAGTDAKATVNGLSITSPTNTLSNVFGGLSVTLGKVTTGPVQINITSDTSGIAKSVQGFVDAYNDLSKLMSTDLAYDASTKTAGPLQADSSAVSLQRQLRSLLSAPSGASSTFSTLSQVGLEVQADGTLKLNSTKLATAMNDPTELKKAFTNVDYANTANNGFAIQLRTMSNTVLGATGLLTARVAGLNKNLSANQADQDKLNDRLSATQARLTKTYNDLDKKMASIGTLSTYITQQIANWNKSTG